MAAKQTIPKISIISILTSVYAACTLLFPLIPSGNSITCWNCTWDSKNSDDLDHQCSCNVKNQIKPSDQCIVSNCTGSGSSNTSCVAPTDPSKGQKDGTYCLEYYSYNLKYGSERHQKIIRTAWDGVGKATYGIPAAYIPDPTKLSSIDGNLNNGKGGACNKSGPKNPEKPKAGEKYEGVCVCNYTDCNNRLFGFSHAISGRFSWTLIIPLLAVPYWVIVNSLSVQ